MVDNSHELQIGALIRRLSESGEHELVEKLQAKARQEETFWYDGKQSIIGVEDLFQILSECGQQDLVRNLKEAIEKSEKAERQNDDKESGQNELLRYRIQSLMQRISKDCERVKLDEAQQKYEQAKQALKETNVEQPSLARLVTPNDLIRAYINAGKVKEAFKLFADESREIAEGTEDKGLQEAGLALSDVDDVGKLIEAGKEYFVEQEKNEEARIQVRRWLLEIIVVGCYASIIFDVFRRLKERKSTLRYKDDYMALKLSAAVKNVSAATMFRSDEK